MADHFLHCRTRPRRAGSRIAPTGSLVFARAFAMRWDANQHSSVLQIERVKSLSKSALDGGEHFASLLRLFLITSEARHTCPRVFPWILIRLNQI